jgi:poly(3-hydroxybutyrate) depolymerase
MAVMTKPEVTTMENGGKYWEHKYEDFFLKVYVPSNDLEGQVNNYGFRAPLLLVFEEHLMTSFDAVAFAENTGLANIAAESDGSVLFVYPTCEGGWENAGDNIYPSVIKEIKMYPEYEDGIVKITDFFTKEFKGYFVRGAIFRADIYSYGKSADYCAKHLLKKVDGEYLWGPGEITPAMVSMEKLSVVPNVERKDIAVLSVANSEEINKAFKGCENLLIKEEANYEADFKKFVRKFKMWCGNIQLEPDFEELNMTEESGIVEVKTSPDNKSKYKDQPTHKVGYFAYYNNGIMDKGPVPLVMGFHGGGDTSMYLTFVAGWWEVCHKHDFLFVSVDDHLSVTATEVMEVIESVKKRYNVDEDRIYATGFSMGSGKTWDLYQEYPEGFAGFMPCSALFPIKENPFGLSLGDPKLNMTVAKPVFYSGGEDSPLPELPSQADTCLNRVQYVAGVNKLKKKFNVEFSNKENWEDKYYGVSAEREEKIPDESRGSVLTVRYYESEDGVCRTAFASVSGQQHECRQHSCENAWKFVSQFKRN